MKKQLLVSAFLFSLTLTAQQNAPAAKEPAPTPAAERMTGLAKRAALEQKSLVKNVQFRSVGPTIMSGRVVDIEVDPNDETKFFVAYASGGLWYTDNNGTTFTPLFDHETAITIGDVCVDWSGAAPAIWVGSGEANSSRSSYSGTGLFYSNNMGKTWEHRGLEESHHIGKIIAHGNTLVVGTIGHLYSPSKERGVYKSTDGGKTWKQTLAVNTNTGVIELIEDPANPSVLFAAAWHRERRAWNFTEAGEGSGIYKSTDGGSTWQLLSGPKSGFPQGNGIGRIGLCAYSSSVMYAVVDNQTNKKTEPADADKEPVLKPEDFKGMPKEKFLELKQKQVERYLGEFAIPVNYNYATISAMIRNNEIKPEALADYVEDANRNLFSTPITGAELYRTNDGGQTWNKTNEKDLENFYFTYGYYFGKIWVSPFNPDEVYMAGVALKYSNDGGKTFKSIDGDNQHGDHHALFVSKKRRGYLINGNDGGINISWDNGKSWIKCNAPAVGQFYSVCTDMATPYNVYGGLQDNGVWSGPSTYTASTSWHSEGQYPYKFVLGGDGMQVQVDPRDNNTVYTGFQFGNYYRVDKTTGDAEPIRPHHVLGEKPLRFNWQSPVWLSRHNSDILYFGSNKLHRSFDKGNTWKTISADLTRGAKAGDVPYGTLTTVHESPMRFGVLYTGSDDGLIHVTQDGGANWKRISDGLPQLMRVNRVQASAHSEGRVYAALSGFHWDHFAPYLYVSENYGTSWTRIGTDLPYEPINVVREDPVNPDLLFVGTDNGVYISFDRGKSFMRMTGSLPAVAVHDMVIQPREHDLVIATHGRSIWIANIAALENMTPAILQSTFAVQEPEVTTRKAFNMFGNFVKDPYASGTYITSTPGVCSIRLLSANGLLLAEMKDTAEVGLNFMEMQLHIDKDRLAAYTESLGDKKEQLNISDPEYLVPLDGTYELEFVMPGQAAVRKKVIIGRK